MELKLLNGISMFIHDIGINRTFMELKQDTDEMGVFGRNVLIEPLWN